MKFGIQEFQQLKNSSFNFYTSFCQISQIHMVFITWILTKNIGRKILLEAKWFIVVNDLNNSASSQTGFLKHFLHCEFGLSKIWIRAWYCHDEEWCDVFGCLADLFFPSFNLLQLEKSFIILMDHILKAVCDFIGSHIDFFLIGFIFIV